jgi:hypothetical protein
MEQLKALFRYKLRHKYLIFNHKKISLAVIYLADFKRFPVNRTVLIKSIWPKEKQLNKNQFRKR